LSAKLMANRSDRHLANLSNCQGTKARSPDQEKVRGFPSWPRSTMRRSFKRPVTRPQPDDQSKAATLRTRLGPYTFEFNSLHLLKIVVVILWVQFDSALKHLPGFVFAQRAPRPAD
jgi:hypothetical protein